MDASVGRALPEASLQAAFTVLSRFRNTHHVVGADQLVIMRRIQDTHRPSALFPVFFNLHQDGGSELKVEVIQMNRIGLKIVQNPADLPARFRGIENPEGIRQLRQLSGMKIHAGGIAFRMVPHDAAFMLHAEVLHLMSHFLKLFSRFKKIGFRSAVGIQKFIDHQNFHRLLRSFYGIYSFSVSVTTSSQLYFAQINS